MAITSADIQNQSFSIDRRGYDVDEVDVFLERMTEEVDTLNNQVAELQDQLRIANERADEAEIRAEEAEMAAPMADDQEQVVAPMIYSETEKDARISALERQLEERRRDVDAIAQALITAQRSGEEIIANAKKTALNTQQDAEEEAKRILDKANAEKQRILGVISELQENREQVRGDYQDMLKEFIASATKTLTEIGGDVDAAPASITTKRPVRTHHRSASKPNVSTESLTATYTTPSVGRKPAVAPQTPKPSKPGKDLTGFGDAADDFEFDDLD